ncbi:ATP-binding cassette domain-containing protein [Devosia sp. BK]|uniref:ABC-F family ATP-binding cassette domain-containing protein n=1 Tax=Devosia sp. BK TaxID=2871706 RepID=UPI00293A3993|nr:ABC-F family ATP-binding cassette domain-containing protein [Devosia sp. BK]MDV3250857.1 ATP-binding cassette domain-containing protein [Devosia sp. BK]
MANLSLRNASLRSNQVLFSDLTLSLSDGDRVGLVAANGRGKSTLLKAIIGQAELSEGELSRSRGLTIGYVAQDVPEAALDTPLRDFVEAALPPADRESEGWRADVALDSLGFPLDLVSKPLREFSGGWQRLGLIARGWVTEPDLLLLDEPTNHLDLGRIAALETWLAALPRQTIVIMASHDRQFLDAATNRTLFLRPEQSHFFPLPYSHARLALDEADQSAEHQRQRDLKEVAQLRKQAAKLTNIGINSGSDLLTVKSKQLRERAEKIETQAVSVHREKTGKVMLGNSGAEARVMLAFENMAIETPDGRPLFSIDKLHIFQGDRVVLLGRNGAGKSQLVNRVAAALQNTSVDGMRLSPQIVPGYLDQALDWLPLNMTPLDFILTRYNEGDRRSISLLAGAGFEPERQSKSIRTLSLGQRSRLALLALRLQQPNFYLLDEPTNHLDIPGQEQLEADIAEHGATCLLVSHDRAFIRGVGTRFVQIVGKRLKEVEGPEDFFAEMASG